MEFGIGAVAVAMIDTLLLSIIHPRLEKLADRAETTRVTVRLGESRHVVDVPAARANATDSLTGQVLEAVGGR